MVVDESIAAWGHSKDDNNHCSGRKSKKGLRVIEGYTYLPLLIALDSITIYVNIKVGVSLSWFSSKQYSAWPAFFRLVWIQDCSLIISKDMDNWWQTEEHMWCWYRQELESYPIVIGACAHNKDDNKGQWGHVSS